MTLRTPEEAATLKCPLARTFDTGKRPTCDGPDCILWRWQPASAGDPRFVAAVIREQASLAQDEAKLTGQPVAKTQKYHKEAVKNVMANPEGCGCPPHEKGWCGLGGKPE